MVRLGSSAKAVASVSPASPNSLHRAHTSSAGRPVTSHTASESSAPPTPTARWSRRGNGPPAKNTTARSSEASSSVTRYSASSLSFSSFFVVPAMAAAVTQKSVNIGYRIQS